MSIPTQVQELINGSGNSFHAKVAQWFSENSWNISVSPYYMDMSQQKAREIDLIAEKVWPIKDFTGRLKGQVAVRLFIECKFLPSYSVFWFTDRNVAATEHLVCSPGLFRANNTYTKKHHYLASGNRVAKLFTSSNIRGQENEPFYKALNQSLHALVSMRDQPPQSFAAPHRGATRLVIDFPVVVCSSFTQMYAADFDGNRDVELITQNFQLEIQYAYRNRLGQDQDELFILDMVEFEQLSRFVVAVAEDAETAAFFGGDD